LLSLLGGNYSLLFAIRLVSDEKADDGFVAEMVNFGHPVFDSFEGLSVCYIIHNNYTMRASVIRLSNCTKSFLTGGIPYLQLDFLVFKRKVCDLKVYTNSIEKVICILVVCVPHQDARFPNPAISDQKKFKKIVIFGCRHFLITRVYEIVDYKRRLAYLRIHNHFERDTEQDLSLSR
jgi:hypothetical protein